MDFTDLLKQRRMVRHYDPEPVPREKLERICRTVRRAPSGGFSQGQRLVVVTEAESRASIATLLHEDEWVGAGREPWLSVAPAHIIVCTREQDYHDRYNEPDKLAATGGVEVTWPVPYWFVDAGALMMLVLAAAIDEGLASAFIGHPDQKRIFGELLGLPDEVVPIGLALVGHPAPDPTAEQGTSRMRSRRRPRGDLVHWERW